MNDHSVNPITIFIMFFSICSFSYLVVAFVNWDRELFRKSTILFALRLCFAVSFALTGFVWLLVSVK